MRARSLIVSSVLALTAATVIPSHVGAIVPTTGFTFESPQRILDNRSNPGGAVVNFPIPVPAGGRTIVAVTLSSANGPTWVYLHPCGVAIDRAQPAANYAETAAGRQNVVPVDPGECATLVGTATLTIDRIASQAPGGDLSYVAANEPTALPVTPQPGQTRFGVTAGLPSDAEAVALWVGIVAPASSPSMWSLVDCDTSQTLGQLVTAPAGTYSEVLIVAPISASGEVCLNSSIAAPVEVDVTRWGYLSPTAVPSAEGLPYSGFVERELPGFEAISPDRLFDTRDAGAPVASGGTYRYQVTGLPARATAVALNLTATQTSGPGFASAYPCDATEAPEVSNVNWTGAGATVPNFSIVSLGSTNELCFDVLSSTHLIADLAGYFVDGGGSGFATVAPGRLFDTRTLGTRVPAGIPYEFNLTGRVPAGTTAAVVNVTITQPAGPGFATVYPCGQAPPEASNVNYLAGETRPNVATVKVPADGRICFFTSAAAHILADLAGAFTPSSDVGLSSSTPFRTFDTRVDFGAVPLDSNEVLPLSFDDPYLRALAWNLTVTGTAGPGFVVGYPCAVDLPTASNVNYSAPGQTVANFAFLTPDADGDLCIYALTSTHVIADDAGAFYAPLPWEVYYDGAPPA